MISVKPGVRPLRGWGTASRYQTNVPRLFLRRSFFYERVAELWSDCDLELRPMLDQARSRAARPRKAALASKRVNGPLGGRQTGQ
jgi:hypothetical protein